MFFNEKKNLKPILYFICFSSLSTVDFVITNPFFCPYFVKFCFSKPLILLLMSSIELKDPLVFQSISSQKDSISLVPRWYFGGLASAGAACMTHPLDTMKVYYQTTGVLAGRQTLWAVTTRLVHSNGFLALYNGLSASIIRQLTYSTVRFGIYETLKQQMILRKKDHSFMPLYERMLIAVFSGACGGLVGTPADVVNVRMQNDIKLENRLRRNYRNAFHGMMEIYRREGPTTLFQGSTMVISRSIMVSIAQLAMYDQYKHLLTTRTGMLPDRMNTHIVSSCFTSITCTILTQPLDVLKTLMMNQNRCSRKTIQNSIRDLYKQSGLLGFYKGFVPASLRIGPHTILVFIIYEQLRIRFGISLEA